MRIQLYVASALSAITLVVAPVAQAAASVITVRPSDTQGWSTADTRANGTVSFVADSNTPLGTGALSLVTGNSTSPGPSQDKAQYMHPTSTQLADVVTLGYASKQISASFAGGMPSYQLPTCLYGVTSTGCVPSPNTGGNSFATFVYEPYVSEGNASVQNNVWQTWNVGAGRFWSTRSEGILTASQGTFTYSLSDLKAGFPNATVRGYGVNVGSNNPNWNTRVDAVVFNGTTYNFEQDLTFPTSKDDCKKDGWKTFTGGDFKNQGKCVSYVSKNDNANNNIGNNPTY